MFHLKRRGTAADGHHLHGVLAHDKQFLRFRKVDRQHPAVVLEQHHTLARDAACGGIMLRRAERPEGFAAVHRRAEDQAQHAAGLVVELPSTHLAPAEQFEVGIRQVVIAVGIGRAPVQAVRPCAELHVEPLEDGLARIVHAAPVGDDHAVERPVALEDVVQQVLVVAAMLALVFIVGAHDGPGTALLHRSLEGREVDLVQGTVVDHHVDLMAPQLLVVHGKVLHAGGNPVLLYPLHVRHDHAGRQEGVFAHILEVAPVQGRTVDIDPGAQQHVLIPVTRLLADGFAVEGRHFGVPRRGEARQRGECRARVVRPAGLIPLVPQDLGADAVRAVGAPHFGDAQPRDARRREFRLRMQQPDLLFERHPRKSVLDTLFKRLRLVQIDGHIAPGLLDARAGDRREGAQCGNALYISFGFHSKIYLK